MVYQIAHSQEFPLDLGRVPKKVRNSYERAVDVLRRNPEKADHPRVVPITSYQGLWRLKLGEDYRLVYRVQDDAVIMLMLDHRSAIYDRLGVPEENESEAVPIVGTTDSYLQLEVAGLNQKPLETQLVMGNELPKELSPEVLSGWGVSEKYHDCFQDVRTEEQLLNQEGKVPDDVLVRVFNGLWPPTLSEIAQKPVRVAGSLSDLEDAAEGKRSLASFLLKLDLEQKEYLSRFEGTSRPMGPWLLKGGPGSGKSTVALYCIKTLLHSLHQMDLFEEDRPLNILYTTFTNALVNTSQHLLSALGINESRHRLEIHTVDKLAYQQVPAEMKHLRPPSESDKGECMDQAIRGCIEGNNRFSFSYRDARFLLEEIEWVLVGQGLESAEEYAELDRTGRGRALGRNQRQHLWDLYQTFKKIMYQRGLILFSERLKAAAKNVQPQYDYIFIDEAQDLKPVAIQFLMGLCHNRKNVFLTADINQSIWGNGFSWTKMASDLQLRGRARILKRNYRTTNEIWQAVLPLAPTTDDSDKETLEVEAVYHGVKPVLAYYENNKEMGERLNSFLHNALIKEKAAPNSAAILCPTEREMETVIDLLDSSFKAKAMRSRDVDIGSPGVKVLTMHAAKGLEFPIVAVVGLERGRMPLRPAKSIDTVEHYCRQQRLFFVACSRAMRHLLVFAHNSRPSRFVRLISEESWQVEKL